MTSIANAAICYFMQGAPRGEKKEESSEIEVTPEMIQAGIGALMSYDHRFDLEDDAVSRIYRAMVMVALKDGKVEILSRS